MKTAADLYATGQTPGACGAALADRHWLRAHLDDPRVRVIEVDVSPAAYSDWHIDGAVLWNIYAELKDADYRTAGPEALQGLVSALGDRPGLHGGVLRVRARLRLVADEALRASRRAHPGLLPRHLAGRGLPAGHRYEPTGPRHRPHRRRGPRPAGRPGRRARRHRPAGHHPGRRAVRPGVPRRVLLALGRRRARWPGRARADRRPPAGRRPVPLRRVVPSRPRPAPPVRPGRPARATGS